MPICPTCHSKGVKKNGNTRHQKQNHLCLACHHQFVEERTHKRISEETCTIIQKALKERVSLEGICRIFTFSMSWLLKFIKSIFDNLPEDLLATVSQSDDVEVALVEIDEQWSHVGNKRDPHSQKQHSKLQRHKSHLTLL